jgi:hypothetical protein
LGFDAGDVLAPSIGEEHAAVHILRTEAEQGVSLLLVYVPSDDAAAHEVKVARCGDLRLPHKYGRRTGAELR